MRTTEVASTEFQHLIQRCQHASDEKRTARDTFDDSGTLAVFRAGSIIWAMAVLEKMFSDLAGDLLLIIKEYSPANTQLKPFMGIFRKAEWAAAGKADRGGLRARASLSDQTRAFFIEEWDEEVSFADGRTISGASFHAVWEILDLGYTGLGPFDDPTLERVLEDFRSRRNRLAHGERSAYEVGKELSTPDLVKKLQQIQSMIDHLDLCLDQWLEDEHWKG